jgi:hypothetical protein
MNCATVLTLSFKLFIDPTNDKLNPHLQCLIFDLPFFLTLNYFAT